MQKFVNLVDLVKSFQSNSNEYLLFTSKNRRRYSRKRASQSLPIILLILVPPRDLIFVEGHQPGRGGRQGRGLVRQRGRHGAAGRGRRGAGGVQAAGGVLS